MKLMKLYSSLHTLQSKSLTFDRIVDWFGNPDYGLGLPIAFIMAFLATAAQLIGSIFLFVGLATRWVSIPLMVAILVAVFSPHCLYQFYCFSSVLASSLVLIIF
jgi:putative oxidoreductase